MAGPPRRSPLFPYTTLFRSSQHPRGAPWVQRRLRSGLEPERLPCSRCREEGREITLHVVEVRAGSMAVVDRKSTRLNSSHMSISYAVFCLKKKSEFTTHRTS